jgi:multidrug efflux pump subunit AcrB
VTIGSFSVRNPVLINILTILILVAGLFSLNRLPQEQFAEIPFYYVNIIVPYPGVSAEDIEQSVTVKIENAMAGMQDLNEVQSTTTEGLSRVTLQFDQGLSDEDFQTRFQEVQNRFTNVELPEGTLNPSVDDFSTNDFLPVVEVVLHGDVPFDVLNETARNMVDQLQTVPDLSSITLIGDRDRQVLVSLDPARMGTSGVSLDEVVGAIRNQNVTVPAGTLKTTSREFLLRTVGTLRTEEQFQSIVVRESGPGLPGVIRLGDLGKVSFAFDEDGTAARFNGQQAVSLQIAKIPGGSSVGILNEVRRRVSSYEEQIPEGISVAYFNDSTVAIRDSLNVLVSNALIGLGLLVIILLIFIGLRNALMTALGIPIAFGLTFIVLDAFGETLNSNTLFGLVLVLGLIVDHAIVIVENSFRLQNEEGMNRHDAAVHGVNQVVVPVIAATLTTVAAFLPLTFLPGIIGKFLRVVPLTVSIALIASTFEATVFIPSHYADWPGGRGARGNGSGRKRRFFLLPARLKPSPSRTVHQRFQGGFRTFLSALYRHRLLVILITLAVMVGVFSLVGRIEQNLFNSEDATLFYVEIEMAPGTPIGRTDEFVRQYEQRLLPLVGNGEVVAINAFIGFSGGRDENVRQANVAQLVVDLTEQDEGRLRSITEIMGEAREMTRDLPGAESVVFRKQQGGPPTDPPVVFRFFGDSFEDLGAVTEAVREQLEEYPELLNINDNFDAGTPELRIRVNEQRAAEFGLNSRLIGQYVRGRFDGVSAGTVFRDNEETDVIVRYGTGAPMSIDRLQQMHIPNADGRRIPFSAVASIEEGEVLSSIRRIDGKREATVTAEAYSTAGVPGINSDIYRLFAETLQPSYPGVVLEVGGEFAEIAETLQEILRVFVIGIFLIYLILATQFNSYTQPLLILITVPFAFVGVILFLLLSGTPLSTTVIYAGVALAGIAVNDTIVLITFANENRRKGDMATSEAVVDAAVTRLRPIILTSLTTIAGLIPTAIGLGGTSVVWGPMASTIIFGLVFSTITTLVVVPSFYGVFYDRRRRRRKETADDTTT